MSKSRFTTFINSFNDGRRVLADGTVELTSLGMYVAVPLQIKELVAPIGQKDGKDLYPSIIIGLPSDLQTLRFVKTHAAKMKEGHKFMIDLIIPDDSKFDVLLTTKSGNKHLSIAGLDYDPLSIREQIKLDSGDHSEATNEEKAWLAANQKRIEERVAAKAVHSANAWD